MMENGPPEFLLARPINDEPLFAVAALDSQAQGLADHDSQYGVSPLMLLRSQDRAPSPGMNTADLSLLNKEDFSAEEYMGSHEAQLTSHLFQQKLHLIQGGCLEQCG